MYLDAVELRRVRKLLSGEKRELLDLQQGKKKLDDDEIRKRLGGISKGQLATLRAKLQAFIAKTVGEYRHRDLPENRVRAVLQTADAYMNSPLPAHGQRTLAKALKLALRYGVFNHLDFMEALRRRLPFFLVGNKTAAMRWAEIDQDLEQLLAAQSQLLNTKAMLRQAHQIKDGGLAGRKAKIEALWQGLPALDLAVHSKTSLLLARTHWICDFLLGRVAECEALLDWAIAVSVQEPWLWGDADAFEAIEAAYFTKVTMVSRDGSFEAALALLETFRVRCEELKRFYLPELKQMKRLLTVRQLLQSGDKKEVRRGLKAMLKEIGQEESVDYHLYSLCLWVLEYCINAKELEMANAWLDLLKGMKLNAMRVSMTITAYMLELSYWLAAQEMDNLDNCTRRLLYYVEDRAADLSFAQTIATGFKSLARNPLQISPALDSFIGTLAQYKDIEEYAEYFELFDLSAHLIGLRASRK